jgi:Na+-translocating ferredoxin:NAD+ oxidoreductase RnfD subunit
VIQQSSNATVALYPNKNPQLRLFALWYFTILMTLWNIAGHTFLGFEQSWAHPVVAVLSACLAQLLLEWIDAAAANRTPRYAGGLANFLNFFPPAIISGFACAMLLYPNNRLMPIVFASVLSICSKSLIRVRMSNGARTHVLNPSNFGIIATLFIFPWVGQAPPYQFTENITGFWHWALPGAILVTGIIVHGFATGRLPLCLAWLVAFVVQGVFRAWLAGNDWFVPLMPMSSAAFILFTLYMVPDPATTPIATGRQVLFGASVVIVYAVIQLMHIVFGLFLALTIVCAARGVFIVLSRRFAVASEESSAVVPVSQLAMASSDSASAA